MEKTSFPFPGFLLISLHNIATCLALNISTDQSSLLALKDHITSDPNHILSTNWSSSSTSVCNWIGITCGSRHQRVTVLNISGMGFIGTIPPQLGNLSFLVSLDLSVNNFYGELPLEFSHLRKLRAINLSFNRFFGQIPPFLGDFKGLRMLSIETNDFKGFIPSSISNMKNLEILSMRFNHLEGNIPTGIATLPSLKLLSLGFNKLNGSNVLSIFNISSLENLDLGDSGLTGDLPSDFCRRLPRLQNLDLSSNMLSGQIPRTISECSELQVLVLTENNFVGTIPGEVGNLQLLKGLDLGHNTLEGRIPDEIGHLNLDYLVVENNKLTGSIPLTIFGISSLGLLYMGNNKLEGPLPREVGDLTLLSVLDLGNNKLTGVIPDEIGNLQLMSQLELDLNNFSGSIPVGIFNMSSLIVISLAQNHISGNIPSTIGHWPPNIQQIHLLDNNINGVLPSSISNLSMLTVLKLSGNKLRGSIPNSLGNLTILEVVDLYGNSLTSDLSFITPLANWKFLRELILSFNPLNAMLPNSIGNISSLQTFSADGCNLRGHIPVEIGNLSVLSLLKLGDNEFTGIVPMTISSLKNLQQFSLGANRISGPFPNGLCELSNLGLLNLSQNQMQGSIPSCLGDVTSLREVYLDSNNFSAIIPSSLGKLNDILKLNLSSNFFNGSLPLEFGNLKSAIHVDLSWNQISGNIPTTLGGLQKLTQLSLAHNRIKGSIPETFGELINLEALDLSYNNISGVIPMSLEELKQLGSFNVSFNRLHGEIPNGGPFVHLPYQSFMSNEGLCGNPQKHVPPCPSNSKNRSNSKKRRLMWIVVASSLIVVIVLASAIVFVLRRRRVKAVKAEDEWLPEVASQRISYYELQRATQGFDGNNLLGSGSFGSVYKGTLADGMIVAVKVFNVQMEGTFQTFDRECEVLRNLRHRNLTKIISSCCNLDFKALILEYMPNQSLDKLLYSRDYCLNIKQRLNIMVDVASALEYLHHGYSVPVIHCDLKPSNVLLDNDMVGHLSDFGIAKLLTKEESIAHTTTFATIGYIAPEYGLEGLISKRSDVYSYGIMLLETFTAKKPNDEIFTGVLNLRSCVYNSLPDELDQIIDADLLTLDEQNLSQKLQCVSSIMELAMNCTANISAERMNMTDVVAALEKIKQNLSSSSDHLSQQSNSEIYIVHVESPENLHEYSLLSDVSSRIIYSYRNVFSGFAARLSPDEVKLLETKDGFISIRPQRILRVQTTHTPSFLGLHQNLGFWNTSNYGEGVIIGLLDTGIYPEHPSFDDEGMPPPPAKWKGKCEFHFTACNNKIIGARDFSVFEGGTPLDENGHGTHTSSTAAGNFVDGANVFGSANGTAVGIAPRAHLAMYKVCNPSGRCSESDMLAAMDAAIDDGVDVISISIGGISGPFWDDNIALGAFSSMAKGILLSCSAGNEGPYTGTLSNEAPWILTVGASTINRQMKATVALGNGVEFDGESIYQPNDFPPTLIPIVYPALNSSYFGAFTCSPESLTNVEGKLVLCGTVGATAIAKGKPVKDAGAAGLILISEDIEGYTIPAHDYVLPATLISYADAQNLIAYINSTSTPMASILFKGTVIGDKHAPTVAFFSSRGPNRASPGILKPDIIGPGFNILAAWPTSIENNTHTNLTFNMISGTSMACPHLAGIAALLKSVHPDWSPAAIKSAIMTTADLVNLGNKPIEDELHLPANVFEIGAGHVNPSRANDPGLIYDIQAQDYVPYLCGLNYTDQQVSAIFQKKVNCTNSIPEADLNYPSFSIKLGSETREYTRAVTNVGEADSTYNVEILPPEGVEVTVSPGSLNFSAVKKRMTYQVTFTRSASGTGRNTNFVQGYLKWSSDKHVVRSPIAVILE